MESCSMESVNPVLKPCQPCGIERLPDEVLLIVWQYLGARDVLAASHVCQRWERLTANRALLVRRRSDVQRAQPSLRILLVTARFTKPVDLLLVTCNLHTLIVHERVPLDDDDVKILSENPHLRHLDIFTSAKNLRLLEIYLYSVYKQLNTLVLNEDLVSPFLMRDLINSSNLTQLHLYGRTYYYPVLGMPLLGMPLLIASRREHFTELTLRCHELPESGYSEISRCPNLVVLRLYACLLLRERPALGLTGLRKLRVLHLTGARMLRTKPLLKLINKLQKHLEELALSGTYFNDDHALALAERLPHLRVLELWSTRASRDMLVELAMNLNELREFDIDKKLYVSQLEIIATHPKLERLRCSRPSDVSESEFNTAAGRLAPVLTPGMRYGRGSMRSDGEGWRSSIYYHWMVDHPPLPLSDIPPSAFGNDFEDDYSLLGPDMGHNDSDTCVPDNSPDRILEKMEDSQPDSYKRFKPQTVDIFEFTMKSEKE